jgi:hypothetical protein
MIFKQLSKLNMKLIWKLTIVVLFISYTLLITTLPPYSYWELWDLYLPIFYKIKESSAKPDPVLLLSHQSASDPPTPAPPNTRTNSYTNANGTPLTYEHWFSDPPEPTNRSTLTPHGAKVACWPSSGGIWIKHVDLLDMHFLGLDCFSNTPRQPDHAAEDAFCRRLAMLGANWWSLPPQSETMKLDGPCTTLESCFAPSITNPYLVAYPESTNVVCYVPISLARENGGELLNGYHHAANMRERCAVIRSLAGQVFYCKEGEKCPDPWDLEWGPQHSNPVGYGFWDWGGYNPDIRWRPPETGEVMEWAERWCERNGWRRDVVW